MFRPRYFAAGALLGALVGCAVVPPAADTSDGVLHIKKEKLIEAMNFAFEQGYWQGWKAANEENDRGL